MFNAARLRMTSLPSNNTIASSEIIAGALQSISDGYGMDQSLAKRPKVDCLTAFRYWLYGRLRGAEERNCVMSWQ